MTAPGIPMLFMGQEFLEDKRWADDPANHPGTLIYWDGLGRRQDHDRLHRFTRELIGCAASTGACGRISGTADGQRQSRAGIHRWIEGFGRDVIVVASLNESTLYGYRIPFPRVASGSRSSTATSTTTGSIRSSPATAAGSRRTDQA